MDALANFEKYSRVMPQPALPNRIREHRLARGLTLEDVADALDTSPGQISKLETGNRPLTLAWMDKIAAYLNVSAGDLLPSGNPVAIASQNGHKPIKSRHLRLVERTPILPPGQHDLPVWGAAQGGPGGVFFNDGEAKEYVQRPPNLVGVMNAYGIRMYGDSMEPRYYEGELLHVNPNRPIRKGCFVAVEKTDGVGLIKQFISKNDHYLVLRQLNPEVSIKIPANELRAVHRIVGSSE